MPCLRLLVEVDGAQLELEFELGEAQPSLALYMALASKVGRAVGTFGIVVERTEETVHPDLPIGYYELRTADRIRVAAGYPAGQGVPLGDARSALRVIEGAAWGAIFPLHGGEVIIGRPVDPCQVDLMDSSISKRHAVLEVGDETLTISDAGSTNGTYVNGTSITQPTVLSPGDRIGVGESLLELFEPASGPLADHLGYADGSLVFNRPPRISTRAPLGELSLPTPPEAQAKSRFPLVTALVPLVMGVVMAVVMQRPEFLLFTLASPVLVVANFIGNRRSGRSDFAASALEYLDGIEKARREAESAQNRSVDWLRSRYPGPDVARDRARRQSPELWHRRQHDPDFLDLRVGEADQPSMITVSVPDRGDKELRAKGLSVAQRFEIDKVVPVSLPLREAGVIGVVGDDAQLEEVARWFLVQLAVHHSPREVATAVVAPGREKMWEWAKWLPHALQVGDGGNSIACDDETASALFDVLCSLHEQRISAQRDVIGAGGTLFSPHVVLFVEPPIRLPAGEVARLLNDATRASMSVVWLAVDRIALPGACQIVLESGLGGFSVTQAEGGKRVDRVSVDRIEIGVARELALQLAPLRDIADEDETASIPTRTDLLDLLDPAPIDAKAMMSRWQQAGPTLAAVLGAGAGGPSVVDLITDGPHGLIGGTTGSGKSELLQTLVASLAATYSPRRINFVLIDYKGGAAFKDCVELPHTVGFVTDLDGRLAERAIESLNAELRWREHVLADGGFKDLAEMRERQPDAAPPNLVLIVDEFAALKTEVPVFIDGVVDIARRGRSLGVHLLLATQKPRGVISADIQANTNLRIALRVTDPAESNDIVDRPDAASLSRHVPGRALVKTGSTEVAEVQVAYVGGPASKGEVTAEARTFKIAPSAIAAVAPVGPSDAPSELSHIVATAVEAAALSATPPQRQPWLVALPDKLALAGDVAPPGTLNTPSVVVGTLDDPASQAQPPYVLDLEAAGSAVVFGTVGTGKTTTLRTIAASLAGTYSPEAVHLYGLDCAGRNLGALSRLPHCGDVVYLDEVDRVRRLITFLTSEADARRKQFGEVGASSATEYQLVAGRAVPVIVTLIDGFGQLWSTIESLDRGVHAEALTSLIREGRSVGIHFVLTADRRSALPAGLSTTVSERLILRMATADEFAMLGVNAPQGLEDAPAGRCWTASGEVQVAVVGDGEDVSGADQASAIATLGESILPPDPELSAPEVRLLPDLIGLNELPRPTMASKAVPIGVDEASLAPVSLDVGSTPLFLVVGPPGSGRTGTLRTIATGLRAANPDMVTHLLGTRRSLLFDEEWIGFKSRGAEAVEEAAKGIVAQFTHREIEPGSPLLLVLIDDADGLTEGLVASPLESLVGGARDAGVVVVAAMTTFKAARAFAPWVQAMRHERAGLVLQPDVETDGDVFYSRLPRRSGLETPPGRGFLIEPRGTRLIQVAVVG